MSYDAAHDVRCADNDRSELTDSRRGAGTTVADPPGTEIPAERRLYDYDNIGNRETDTDGAATPPGTRYTTNALNQYTMTRGFVESFVHDADGNMTKSGLAAGDFDADGDIDAVDFNVFQNCFNGPNNPPKAACTTLATDIDGDGDVDSADFSLFQGCYNGPNRPPKCNAGVRPTQYTWDAENRLIAAQPIIPQEGEKKATFAYDYMGRRVRKTVSTYTSGAWVEDAAGDQLFVYDGWNIVMVLDANASNATLRKYMWGLDRSGTIHAAGGIGGLLAVEETATEGSPKYWFFYDGNGNVGQVLWYAAGSTPPVTRVAHYEYDPYGNAITINNDVCAPDGTVITANAGYANDNPFRFSTKPFDGETGTYYYIFRPYWPRLGRWGSRDRLGEVDNDNLYQHSWNNPTNVVDMLGLYGDYTHRDKTRELAIEHGLGAEADLIARCNKGVDDIPAAIDAALCLATGGLVGCDAYDDHFPGAGPPSFGGHQDPVVPGFGNPGVSGRILSAVLACDACALGKALHTLQDSYSHEGPPDSFGHEKGRGYPGAGSGGPGSDPVRFPPKIGIPLCKANQPESQGLWDQGPDIPENDPGRHDKALADTGEAMDAYKCNCSCPTSGR